MSWEGSKFCIYQALSSDTYAGHLCTITWWCPIWIVAQEKNKTKQMEVLKAEKNKDQKSRRLEGPEIVKDTSSSKGQVHMHVQGGGTLSTGIQIKCKSYKMQLLIQRTWDRARESTFLTSSQVMPVLLVCSPHVNVHPTLVGVTACTRLDAASHSEFP